MRRVLVTRPAGQQEGLLAELTEHEIEGVAVPSVSIARANPGAMRRVVADLDGVDWLVITSANGARALTDALDGTGLPASLRVAAVGPATAGALQAAGLQVDAMPGTYLTVAIADVLGPVDGKRIVLARADSANRRLRDTLVERGAIVREVVAYRTIVGPPGSRDLLRRALDEGFHAVLFTSGSTVRGLLELAAPDLRQRLTSLPAICIGPVTAESARRAGFPVAAIATEHTAAGLARAVADYFSEETS